MVYRDRKYIVIYRNKGRVIFLLKKGRECKLCGGVVDKKWSKYCDECYEGFEMSKSEKEEEMKKDSNSNIMKNPVFCPDCRRSNTFIRCQDKDVEFESGRIFEKAWKCRYCGYVAYRKSCIAIFKEKEKGLKVKAIA